MPTFDALITPRRLSEHRFLLDVPDGWQQGRGAFGGFVLGSLARAVLLLAGGPERALRTLTGELCGPLLPGEAEILLEPLRMGSGTSTIAARAVQQGEVQAHAVVVLGRARNPEPRYDGLSPPTMPPWSEQPTMPGDKGGAPFTRFFEYRPVGVLPFAGSAEARAAGFIRAHEPGPSRDGAFLVGMADCWWPAFFSAVRAPRPAATITFTIDVVGDCDGLDPDAPFFHEARTLIAREGWAPELRTLWGSDGRLLAINHQTFVIIK